MSSVQGRRESEMMAKVQGQVNSGGLVLQDFLRWVAEWDRKGAHDDYAVMRGTREGSFDGLEMRELQFGIKLHNKTPHRQIAEIHNCIGKIYLPCISCVPDVLSETFVKFHKALTNNRNRFPRET